MGTSTRWKGVLAVALAFTLALAACGGRDDDNNSSGGGGGGGNGGGGDGEGFTIDTSECTSYNPTQGVTDTSIKLGSSFPETGLYSAFAKIAVGYEAYFNYINEAEGGVGGRKIEVVTKNDEYLPDRTRSNVNELLQSDGVFGLLGVVGTPNNLAIRGQLTDECVPDLFVATGSQLWGETEAYPWLIGSIPSYTTEAAIFADYLKKEKPQAKVAILKQNDDFGEGYDTAFRAAIEGSEIQVVGEESYNVEDPGVQGQITTLSQSRADTILLAATALKCPQSLDAIQQSGWDPTIYISATCTSSTVVGLAPPGSADGVLSSLYLKDPADPQWDSDPAMQEFQTLGQQYGISAEDINNGIVGFGWTLGALMVETFKQSPEITRQAVMQKAYSLSDVQVGLLLPGISINTNGAEDPFPIEQMQVAQYNGSYWQLEGELTSFEGKTLDYTG
jgi:branched-chain amino acid transport system substrate-binding protein